MEENAASSPTPEVEKISFFTKFGQIFTSPARAFENIAARPDWIIPVILIILLSIVSVHLLQDIILDSRIELVSQNEDLSEEQKDQQIEGMRKFFGSTAGTIFIGFVSPIAGGFILVLVIAGAFLLTGNVILGGESNFKSMLALAAWGYIISIPETLIKVPMMLAKNSIHVYTSLAVLFETDQANTVLFKIADAVDVFVIWRVAVWSIGFAVMYKFAQKKATMAVVGLTVLYFVLAIGLGSLFQ